MADPVTTFFTVLSITTSTWKLGEYLYGKLSSLRSAGSHIQRTTQELKLLCPVLGSLHAALLKEQQAARTGSIPAFMAENMQDLLRGCTTILYDIDSLIQPYAASVSAASGNARLSYFKAYVWELSRKDELLVLSRALASYKLTVNVACSSLMLLRESQTQSMVEDLHRDVLELRDRVEQTARPVNNDTRAGPGGTSGWFDRAHSTLHVDQQRLSAYNLPLQRFLTRTGSLISHSSAGATQDSDSWRREELDADMEEDDHDYYDNDDEEYNPFKDPSPPPNPPNLDQHNPQQRQWQWRQPSPSPDSPTDYDTFKGTLLMSSEEGNSNNSIQPTLFSSTLLSLSQRANHPPQPRLQTNQAAELQGSFPAPPAPAPAPKPKLHLAIPSTPESAQVKPLSSASSGGGGGGGGGLHRSPAFRISPRQDWCSSPYAYANKNAVASGNAYSSGSATASVGSGGLLTPVSPDDARRVAR